VNLILKTRYAGGTYTARAYAGSSNPGRIDMPLGITATCTEGAAGAALQCAARWLSNSIHGTPKHAAEYRAAIGVKEIIPGSGVFKAILPAQEAQAA
jgi:hypothetical protein